MHFSVIIPACNVERYISECVMSAVDQQLEGEHEVLVVDDGSTDGTADLLRQLSDRYSIVHVIYQANHGAPGKARNAAIALARGDYLVFLDSDDRLPAGTLHFYQGIVDACFPCLIAGSRNIIDEASRHTGTREHPPSILGRQELDGTLGLRHRSMFRNASGKAFRRSVVAEHRIRFTEGHPGQDTAFTLQFLAYARLLYCVNTPVYDVRIRGDEDNPSLTQQFDPDAVRRRLISASQCVDSLLEMGKRQFAADAHAYFLMGILSRVIEEHKRGRAQRIGEVYAIICGYRLQGRTRVTVRDMSREHRRMWRLAGLMLATLTTFRSSLWAICALRLR